MRPGVPAYALMVVALVALSTFGSGVTSAAPSFRGLGAAISSPTPPSRSVDPGTQAPTPSATMPDTPVASVPAASADADPVLARAVQAGVNPHFVFVPRWFDASVASEVSGNQDYVVPPYTAGPAPMGITDYGLRNASNGSVVPYRLNTTRLVGSVDQYGRGIVPFYLLGGAPDSYAIQLDAVTTNITLFGQPGYEFWTQNILEYSVGRHLLTLVTNVWNFSAPGAVDTANAFAAHGPNGHLVPNDLYYAELTIPNVRGPFDATLYINNTVNASRNEVDFSAVVSGPSGTLVEPFDYVVFNSTVDDSAKVTEASNFTADGFSYNPVGLTNDFELDVGGPGDGLQTNLYAAQANLSLEYWNATTGSYEPVPSASSFGGDAGETASGACLAWLEGPGGPGGANTYAVMSSGPAFLHGLWNASTPAGVTPIAYFVDPSNAWVFFQLVPPAGQANFSVIEIEWAPTELNGGQFFLSPGVYNVAFLLSEYRSQSWGLNVGAPSLNATITLVPDTALGIYTPIWVWNDSQFAGLAASGSGTPADPYVLFDTQPVPFASEFGVLNDFTYPVFPGVLFTNTNASVELEDPPSFATATPFPPPQDCSPELSCLPATNSLAYQFYNVSNVAVVGAANISGWFGTGHGIFATLFPTLATDTMLWWNSSHDLIAGNSFDLAAAGGIYLYGGGSNTIWGNLFRQGAAPYASPGALLSSFYGIGVQEMEDHDLVYNNAFDNTRAGVTAWTPTLNPYTQLYKTWTDTWNVSLQPAGDVNYAPGFPGIPLSGSIVNTPTQGGSFWWDYGTASNPLLTIPYDASGYISVGGDYHPLIPEFSVNFTETGLPDARDWSVTLNGVTESTTNQSLLFAYQGVSPYAGYQVGTVAGYVAIPSSGSLTLNLTYTTNVTIRFYPDQGTLAGSVVPTNATVKIDGAPVAVAPDGAFSETLPVGTHAVIASARGYYSYYSNVTIVYNATTTLAISLDVISPVGPNGTLALTVVPANATIRIDGSPITLSSGAYTASETPGTYAIVGTAAGYYDYFNNVTVVSGTVSSLAIALNPVVPPLGPDGNLSISVSTYGAVLFVDGAHVGLTNGAFLGAYPPGLHSIGVEADGYYPFYNNVTVKSHATTSLTITLDPISATSTSTNGIGDTGWVVIGGLAAVALIFFLTTVVLARREQAAHAPPAAPPPESPPSGGSPPPPSG